MELTVYLAGQIHDDWRDEIRAEAERQGLPIAFVGPQDDHATSDDIGEAILGEQPNARWKDETASQVNNLRTRVLMAKADVVVAREQAAPTDDQRMAWARRRAQQGYHIVSL